MQGEPVVIKEKIKVQEEQEKPTMAREKAKEENE